MLAWRLANPGSIRIPDANVGAWHAGHVADAVFLPGRRILAGAQTGGLWVLGREEVARCLTDDWDDPDVTAMVCGPDGPCHVFVATKTAVWESKDVPDAAWTRHPLPSGGVHQLEVLVGPRRIVASGQGGVWWASIPRVVAPGGLRWTSAVVADSNGAGLSRSPGFYGIAALPGASAWRGFVGAGDVAFPARGAPAATARQPFHRDVFWIAEDGSVVTSWNAGAESDGWAGHSYVIAAAGSADPFGGAVAATCRNPGHIDVFWVRPDGAIVTTWWDATVAGGWHPATAITPPRSASLDSRIAVVCRDDLHVDVFWAGPDRSVRRTSWGPAGWLPEPVVASPAGSIAVRSAIVAVAPHAYRVESFWITPDGGLRTFGRSLILLNRGGSVSDVVGPGRVALGGGVAAVARMEGHVDVFWVSGDGSVVTSWSDAGDAAGWNGHSYAIAGPGSATPESALVGVARNPLHLDVAWVASNGRVQTTWWDANDGAGWRGHQYEPALDGGVVVNTLVGFTPHEDALEVCGVTGTGEVLSAAWSVTGGRVVAGTRGAPVGVGGLYVGDFGTDSAGLPQLTMRPAQAVGLIADEMIATSVACCRFRPTVVYAVAASRSSGDGQSLYQAAVSTDAGQTWRVCGSAVVNKSSTLQIQAGGQGNVWNNCIGVSPVDWRFAVIGWQFGAFVSGDGGLTWRQDDGNQHPQIHADLHAIRFDPADRSGRSFLIASDGGVCATFDAGMSYDSRYNASLTNLQFYTTDGRRQWTGTLGVSYIAKGLVAGGLQDNGNQYSYLDRVEGPSAWTKLDDGDGGVVTFIRSGVLLRNIGLQPSPQPIKYSIVDGEGGHLIDQGVIPITRNKPNTTGGENGLLNAGVSIVNQPIDRNSAGSRVEAIGYAGADVFALFNPTGNAGWRWEYVGSLPLVSDDFITAGGSANSELVFLGTFSGQIYTMDRNGKWALQPIDNSVQDWLINRLCILSDRTGFALYNQKVLASTPGGRILRLDADGRWRSIGRLADGTAMPDEVYYAIEADWTTTPPALFAATDSTVLSSTDAGNTWTRDVAGLPTRPHCADMRFVLRGDGQKELFLSTFGRSLWRTWV